MKYIFLVLLLPSLCFSKDQITIIETSSSTPIDYTIHQGNIQKFKVTKDCNYTKFSMDKTGNQYVYCDSMKILLNPK